MGGEFRVDPASLRATAAQLDGHASEVASHGETLGASTAGAVGHGPIGQVVETAVRRGVKIVAHDISAAVRKFYGDAGTVMRRAADDTERTDGSARTAFDGIEHDSHDVSAGSARPVLVGHHSPSGEARLQGVATEHPAGPLHQDPTIARHRGNSTQDEFNQHFPELTGINPMHRTRAWEYRENCQSCVIATDQALAAGRHVRQASPRDPLHPDDPPFDWPTNITNTIGGGKSFKRVGGYDAIMRELRRAGDGSRGVIYGGRLDQQGDYISAHVFNVVNKGGKIHFVDGQTGGWARLENFGVLEFLRTK